MSSTDGGQRAASAAPARSAYSPETLTVALTLAAAAALAWAWLSLSPRETMDSMPMGVDPVSPAYLVPAFAMWAIMMVAMMVPSAAPMILLRARLDRTPSTRARAINSLLFAASYLFVWGAFSAAAAFVQALLVGSGIVSHASLAVGSRTLAAGLLMIAGAYELTVAKRVCLDKCQSPLLFMLRHFRPGAAGAARLGLVHGLYCLGCCWALMLLLFVGGVMNLAWVALLALVVLGEKLAPPEWRADRAVAALLFAGALALLVR